jgi:hypothetical protein
MRIRIRIATFVHDKSLEKVVTKIYSYDLWILIHGVQIRIYLKNRKKYFFFKDGTFETSPPPFADGQIVFIHAKLPNGRAMPAAFALLSRKVFVN